MKGARFTSLQPNVTIKFYADDVIATKMYAQVDPPNYPSNIQQICVTLYDRNLKQLTYSNGTTIPMLKSPINNTVIQGWFQGLKTIRVQLCNTTDGKPPNGFRFAVVGCYSSVATYIISQSTQPSRQFSTMTTSNPNNTLSRKKRNLIEKLKNIPFKF
jgi:hypothetical protein